jgi:hypothetical protein
MDSVQAFVFDLGWFFFAAWGMVIVAVSFIAFKSDLSSSRERQSAEESRLSSVSPLLSGPTLLPGRRLSSRATRGI